MLADLDALVTALYVRVDDFLLAAAAHRDRALRRRSPTAELIRWRSRRCSWACPTTASSSRSPATGSFICSRTCPSSPAYNKRLRALGPRIAQVHQRTWRSARRRSATGSGCWTPRRCRAASRARPPAARSSPATPATATAAATAATSGAFGSTCCARPTACRSASSSRPPTPPSARSPPRCSNASRSRATPSSPTRASRAKSSSTSSPTSAPACCAPTARNEPRRNGSLGLVRQWIESVFWTCKGQLALERHGGRTLTGLCVRVALRLLALAAGLMAQLTDRRPRPPLHRLRPLIRNQPSSRPGRACSWSAGRPTA